MYGTLWAACFRYELWEEYIHERQYGDMKPITNDTLDVLGLFRETDYCVSILLPPITTPYYGMTRTKKEIFSV
jgi:hypothetical protein